MFQTHDFVKKHRLNDWSLENCTGDVVEGYHFSCTFWEWRKYSSSRFIAFTICPNVYPSSRKKQTIGFRFLDHFYSFYRMGHSEENDIIAWLLLRGPEFGTPTHFEPYRRGSWNIFVKYITCRTILLPTRPIVLAFFLFSLVVWIFPSDFVRGGSIRTLAVL